MLGGVEGVAPHPRIAVVKETFSPVGTLTTDRLPKKDFTSASSSFFPITSNSGSSQRIAFCKAVGTASVPYVVSRLARSSAMFFSISLPPLRLVLHDGRHLGQPRELAVVVHEHLVGPYFRVPGE